MSYSLITLPKVEENIKQHIKSGNRKLALKLLKLLEELIADPRNGTGKPEELKGYQDCEIWSRRIDQRHRLIYEIKEHELIVIAISAWGHYNDK